MRATDDPPLINSRSRTGRDARHRRRIRNACCMGTMGRARGGGFWERRSRYRRLQLELCRCPYPRTTLPVATYGEGCHSRSHAAPRRRTARQAARTPLVPPPGRGICSRLVVPAVAERAVVPRRLDRHEGSEGESGIHSGRFSPAARSLRVAVASILRESLAIDQAKGGDGPLDGIAGRKLRSKDRLSRFWRGIFFRQLIDIRNAGRLNSSPR